MKTRVPRHTARTPLCQCKAQPCLRDNGPKGCVQRRWQQRSLRQAPTTNDLSDRTHEDQMTVPHTHEHEDEKNPALSTLRTQQGRT